MPNGRYRYGETGNPFLRRDGSMAGEPQCETCRGAGYLKAEFKWPNPEALAKLAEALPNEPIPVSKTICGQCNGSGSIYPNPRGTP